MMKSRLNSFGSCGSMVSARARFVDGPMTTPISSPGWACAASAQAWAADTALSGARGAGSRRSEERRVGNERKPEWSTDRGEQKGEQKDGRGGIDRKSRLG